jgi:hypothetical protein
VEVVRTGCSGTRSLQRAPPHRAVKLKHPEHKTPGELTITNTVRLHRVLATKPEKVYRAFIDTDAMSKWLPPNGFT